MGVLLLGSLDDLLCIPFGFNHSNMCLASLCSPGLKAKKILEEVRPGIWTFPVFTEAFCDQLEEELCHFLASGILEQHTKFNGQVKGSESMNYIRAYLMTSR